MAETNVWKRLDEAKANLVKRAQAVKNAFMEMPGGMPPPGGDPAAGGMPPGADLAAGGMPPEMAGGMPPGGDPTMGGMDPTMLAAMAGGGAPLGVDAATAGMLGGAGGAMPPDAAAGGAVAGAAGAGTPEPTITISLSQLWDVVTKVLGLAKKIGANGQGVAAEPAPAQPQGGLNQDAVKAAVIEALGDMGAMKTAAATPAQSAADMANLRKIFASAAAKAKASSKGTTIKWTPEQIAAFQAFSKKNGQPNLNEVMK